MIIETKGIAKLAIQLHEVHRAALPNAVRFTLNDLAFDVKKIQLMPALVSSYLIIRKPSFFKKYSGVDKAVGWEIDKMISEVGMIPKGDASHAVERLKQQDEGGSLIHTQVPLYATRRDSSHKKLVQNQLYWSKIKIKAKIQYGDKQGLIRAVTATRISHAGGGTPVGVIYGKYLFGIQGFTRIGQKQIKLHLTRLYEVEKEKTRHIKAHHFMRKASNESGRQIQELFNRNAEKQLSKFKNRIK
jgi:hypothetical protein